MAHKKGQGTSANGRDSNPKMLGVKLYDGETAKPGSIIMRQRGTRIHPGVNVGRGADDTLYSTVAGLVKFERVGRDKKRVSVYPA